MKIVLNILGVFILGSVGVLAVKAVWKSPSQPSRMALYKVTSPADALGTDPGATGVTSAYDGTHTAANPGNVVPGDWLNVVKKDVQQLYKPYQSGASGIDTGLSNLAANLRPFGAIGPTGVTGASGEKGATGANGQAGATGATGANGQAGATGATGANGVGYSGIVALNAMAVPLPGTTGLTLAVNTVGALVIGDTIRVVSQNDSTYQFDAIITGAVGPNPQVSVIACSRPSGATKTGWSISLIGTPGATGATGAGTQGAIGVTGAAGAIGPTGVTGAAGVAGATGVSGAQGIQGATGATGVTGVTGAFNGTFNITFCFSNGGSAITTSTGPVNKVLDFAFTITGVTVTGSPSGAVQFDLKKCAKANYTGSLTSIVASAPPKITSGTETEDVTLTGWTTAVSAGDTLQCSVTSATTISEATVTLKCIR